MKTQFNSLQSFVSEIERQEQSKRDYLVPSSRIKMLDDDKTIVLDGVEHDLTVNNYMHSQIAAKHGIPKNYYDSMSSVEGLRAHNVNAWLKHNEDRKHLVRTMDNSIARAYLSDKFKPIDNFFIMQAALPILAELKDSIDIKANILSETRMYMQITSRRHQGEVKQGDVIMSGIVIANSEVGAGAVDIREMVWRLLCANGLIGTSVMRQHHAGRRIDEEQIDIFKNDTLQAELKSLQLRMRDMIQHALSETVFTKKLEQLKSAAGDQVKKPVATIENVTKHFNGLLLKDEAEKILVNMSDEGNMNRYGLANGITHLAHEIDNPDRAYTIERAGQKIIELSASQWESLNAA